MTKDTDSDFLFADPGTVRVVSQKPLKLEAGGQAFNAFAKPAGRPSQNEAAAWLVAKRLGLETLEAWLFQGEDGLLFATRKSPFESLKEAGIGYRSDYWKTAVNAPWFAQCLVFDTLVGNYDRVLKNICFKPGFSSGRFVFLDHDKIFFHDDWNPGELAATRPHPGHNNLVRMLEFSGPETARTILARARAWQHELAGEDFGFLAPLEELGLLNGPELAAVQGFLTHRARALTPLVYRHLQSA